MTKNQIKKALEDTLLHDGEMNYDLYEYQLEEKLDSLKESQQQDNDEFIFTVTVNRIGKDYFCALALIDKTGEIYINEAGREKLKTLWFPYYMHNIKLMLPRFVQQLHNDEIPINGVKTIFQA